MKIIFREKNILTFIISGFIFAVIIVPIFFGQIQRVKAMPLCDCNLDTDCSAACSEPDTPLDLTWLTGATETMLRPTWSSVSSTNYYNLVGVSGSALNINATSTSYDHSGLNPGTYYSYEVKGCKSGCYSCSGQLCGTSSGFTGWCAAGPDVCSPFSSTWGATTAFTAPTGLDVSCWTTGNDAKATVNWADHSSAETGYKIEYKYSGGSYGVYDTVSANTVTYDTGALQQGRTVSFRVRAYHNSGTYSSYTAEDSCSTVLTAPDGLIVTGVSQSQINLSWSDNSLGEEGFEIERASNSDCSGSPAFSLISAAGAGAVSFNDSGLADGTRYCYRIRAYYSGNHSDYSNTASAITVLPAPASLNCSTQGGDKINLFWSDNSINETGFKLERTTSTCSGFVYFADAEAEATSYSDTGLTSNTTYCYKAKAYNSFIESSYSGTASCTTTNPPAAPSSLAAVASATSSTQINLSWTDNSSSETGFHLRRAAGSACDVSSPLVQSVGSNVISASDINLGEGTKYCYIVCAYNNDGEACSALATATTSLSAPSGTTFETIAPTSLVINWVDNSIGEAGFKIERAIGSCSAGFSQIGTAGANAIVYSDTTLTCSGLSYDSYCYRVRAYTADADSSYATVVSVKPTLPCAVSGLNASIISAEQIDLHWNDNSGNETGFRIDKKTGSGGTYSSLATKDANVTSHSDSGLSDGTTYYYRVYPYNNDGDSNYSEVFATTTLPAPSNFLATANSSSQIDLTWTDNSNNETGFKIERATTTCSGFLPVHTTVANVTSYSDEALLQNTTYCYRAYAFNDNISSSYTNESSTTTEIFIPSGYLESSTFDVNSNAIFNTILWNGQLNGGHVRFTFASSNCPNGATDYPTCAGGLLWGNSAGGGAPFLGSDGTETGYYGPADPGKAIPLRFADHNQRRYFRYRIYLTAGLSDSPNVYSVIIGYSP
ncbi:MAG TPA: fibronectin type III domain-containing protein [Candidatus Paceibacterota bacterium]|nr:fibronectin type III domain-containing protein [Candidatus Paceibacterota bacterium]HRY76621.1 fibronectin type III domain-containing protein [Candidatus Paceibacterota bacterium]